MGIVSKYNELNSKDAILYGLVDHADDITTKLVIVLLATSTNV